MPRKCCVPNCKSNYASCSEGPVQTFKFPSDENLKKHWLRAIPRKNFSVTKYSAVCINHFASEDIISEDIYKDSEGVIKKYILPKSKLKNSAIPSIFFGLPSYLSKNRAKPRNDPEVRRNRIMQEESTKIDEALKRDLIFNYELFKTQYLHKLVNLDDWYTCEQNNHILLYKLNCDREIYVSKSIKISRELKVEVYIKNFHILYEQLSNILPKSLNLSKYSQLDSLLNYCNSFEIQNEATNIEFLIERSLEYLSKALKTVENSDNLDGRKLHFLTEQIKMYNCKQIRYSLNTIVISYMMFSQSPGCYNSLRENNILTLPHYKHLQKITMSFQMSPNSESENTHFLQFMAKSLTDIEKYVAVQFDEIYVNTAVIYKSGEIIGSSINNNEAKTLLAFMVSSVYGSFKEVVALIPVHKLTGELLNTLYKQCVELVQSSGLKVLVSICDNNRINQSNYKMLTNNDLTKFEVQNSKYDMPTFITYDTVHVFKNIRNNWLNQLDTEKTLIFPEFNSDSKNTLKAKLSDIRNLYSHESSFLIKSAPKLNYKTLYPNTLERQKVILVDNLFHLTTYIALENSKLHLKLTVENGTIEFLKIINQWWSIMNIKSVGKGVKSRNPWLNSFSALDDDRLVFLENFLLWLENWRKLNLPSGHLTKDTFQSLYQCTSVMIKLIKYSLCNIDVKYFLPGKIQTDNLEKRFGRYRNLSGCSYNVTVCDILQAEKKLRLKSVLGLHSSRYGNVKFNFNIFHENVDVLDKCIISNENLKKFEQVLNYTTNDSLVDKSALLYISGYAVHKLIQKINCDICKSIVLDDNINSSNSYFTKLQRGGLHIPTPLVLSVCQITSNIMQNLISETYEKDFLKTGYQKDILTSLSMKFIQQNEPLNNIYLEICICGQYLKNILERMVATFANILLNNYTKHKNDILSKDKGIKKKKLTTLLN